MASSFAGKVFVITGGGSGIGLATASTLLARGALLALCDVNEEGLSKFIGELDENQRSRVITDPVDITKRSAVQSFLSKTKKHFGKIDGVANIAGTAGHNLGHEEIWEVDDKEFDFVMGINVRGIFNVLSEALKPGLLEGPGSIVHIASMYAERGFAKGSVYSTSKHAGIGMAKSAAIEAGKRGIRVNVVMPGPIDTPMLRANQAHGGEGTAPDVPMGRLGKSEEVASVVAFLLSEEAGYVTGATWSVDGGANV